MRGQHPGKSTSTMSTPLSDMDVLQNMALLFFRRVLSISAESMVGCFTLGSCFKAAPLDWRVWLPGMSLGTDRCLPLGDDPDWLLNGFSFFGDWKYPLIIGALGRSLSERTKASLFNFCKIWSYIGNDASRIQQPLFEIILISKKPCVYEVGNI